MDDLEPIDGSAVDCVVDMSRDHTYSRSLYIPHERADPTRIKDARRKLVSYLTPVVARARKYRDRNYKIHTVAMFASNYDVIVTGVICIEPKGRNDV